MRCKHWLCVGFIFWVAPFAHSAAPPTTATTTVIHAGWLLAEPGEPALREQTVTIVDGEIAAVEAGYREVPEATPIDLKAYYVLPGLMDLHKHVAMPLDAPPEVLAARERLALQSAAVLRELLHAGVTTIRDVGDNTLVTFALRDAIAAGHIEGPRVVAAGRIISRTGGHGTIKQTPGELDFVPGGCDGPESCRRVVRENVQAGSDWIKVTVSGSGGEATGQAKAEPIMLPEEVEAVMTAARLAQRPVVAHAHSTAAINLALSMGARSIDHGVYFNDESVRLFKANKAYLIPTAYVAEFVSKQLEKFAGMSGRLDASGLKEWTQNAMANPGRAYRAGITLGVGSDSGTLGDAHATVRELELFVAAGVPAAAAIKAATLTNAQILRLDDKLGRVRAGYAADLIAIEGDPHEDVSRLNDVAWVMRTGKVAKPLER